MKRDGPTLESLTRRLAETPPDFLAEPLIGGHGTVAVAALVNDLLLLHGARAPHEALRGFEGTAPQADRNRLALTMVAVWLLADEWFRSAGIAQAELLGVLTEPVAELAPTAPAHKFVQVDERREELVRVVLAGLDYRPAGETVEQATDRLAAMSGSTRRKLIEASKQAEKRARAIREALAAKAAAEAADKWTRD